MADESVRKSQRLTAAEALAAVIGNICKSLNVKDLGRVAQVCKSWHQVAEREMKSRGMERIMLFKHNDFRIVYPVIEKLRVKPHVALIFSYQDPNEPDFNRTIFQQIMVCAQFMDQFPDDTIVLPAERIYVERCFLDTDTYDEDNSFKPLNPSVLPCLIFPKHENLDVKSIKYFREDLKAKNVKSIVQDLVPKNTETKTFLMLFTLLTDKEVVGKIVKSLEKQVNKQNFGMWGSELCCFPVLHDAHDPEKYKDDDGNLGLVGISISSEHLNMYSTVISCEHMKISTYLQELEKFKDSVKLEEHSMAFVTGPVFEDYYLETSDEEMYKQSRIEFDEFYTEDYEKCYLYHLKKKFPTVPFTAVFQPNVTKTFATDTLNGSNANFARKDSLSVMIVTW